MSDKVYPVLPRPAEGHGRPSAPPIGLYDATNTVAIPMPATKAIHEEQERSLISNYHHEANDQMFYGRPAAAGRGRRRRRSCCCCCLASFLGTLAIIVVIVGVAALVLKPKAPKFSVTDATVNEFKLSTGGTPPAGSFNLNTDIVFSVEARNPNKKISFYYDDVAVTLLYANQQIGWGSIPAFNQPHKNTTILTLPIQGRKTPLTSSSGGSLQTRLESDASIPLQVEAGSRARVKVGRWKSRRHEIHVICAIQLSNASANATQVSVLSESCKLKLKIAHINLTL